MVTLFCFLWAGCSLVFLLVIGLSYREIRREFGHRLSELDLRLHLAAIVLFAPVVVFAWDAERFGISETMASLIIRRKAWQHVE